MKTPVTSIRFGLWPKMAPSMRMVGAGAGAEGPDSAPTFLHLLPSHCSFSPADEMIAPSEYCLPSLKQSAFASESANQPSTNVNEIRCHTFIVSSFETRCRRALRLGLWLAEADP